MLANTNLEILAIENALLNPPFDTNVTHYKVEVPNEMTRFNLLAIPENEQARVEVKGKDDLQEGDNSVYVEVIAANGFTKKQYEVVVHRRTIEEQQQYEKEQKENKEKWEEINTIEKTAVLSNDNEKTIHKEDENTAKSWLGKIGIAVIAIGVIFIVAKRYGKRKNK